MMKWCESTRFNNDDFIQNTGRTNDIIAAYTTAQARLKLNSYLEQLHRRVLYADTDSIVFTTKLGEWEPELSDYLKLGDLTIYIYTDFKA